MKKIQTESRSIIFLMLAIALSVASAAQVTKISLQASGLTCSMCSNAIYKALKTLDFADKIEANVKTYTFEVYLKPNSHADFDLVRKKVEGAGFGIASFIATVHFNNVKTAADQPVKIDDKTFVLIKHTDEILDRIIEIKITDKGFISAKDYSMSGVPSILPGTYHATLN